MKTIITVIAAGFILNAGSAFSQSVAVVNNEAIMATETKPPTLIISEVSFKPMKRQGYNVTWETQNQFNVASFELQISEDNSHWRKC